MDFFFFWGVGGGDDDLLLVRLGALRLVGVLGVLAADEESRMVLGRRRRDDRFAGDCVTILLLEGIMVQLAAKCGAEEKSSNVVVRDDTSSSSLSIFV